MQYVHCPYTSPFNQFQFMYRVMYQKPSMCDISVCVEAIVLLSKNGGDFVKGVRWLQIRSIWVLWFLSSLPPFCCGPRGDGRTDGLVYLGGTATGSALYSVSICIY